MCGEVGIAGLFALGIKIGRVERRRSVDLQHKDYAKLAPFFKRLFEKAVIKGVSLVLPYDVMTAPKYLPKGYVEKNQEGESFKEEHKTEVTHFEDPDHEAECTLFNENVNIHWSDVACMVGKSRIVDIEEQVRGRLATYCSSVQANSQAFKREAS